MENRCSGLSSLWAPIKCEEEEFQESDVWESVHSDEATDKTSFPVPIKASAASKLIQTASSKMAIPKSRKGAAAREQQHSAPVDIPEWSKIGGERGLFGGSWESDEEEWEGNLIPPHEWVARKQTWSFSVCEGAGRTLKGRDLSRVRNAVLTRTGFLESN